VNCRILNYKISSVKFSFKISILKRVEKFRKRKESSNSGPFPNFQWGVSGALLYRSRIPLSKADALAIRVSQLMGFQRQDWNQRGISRINARLSLCIEQRLDTNSVTIGSGVNARWRIPMNHIRLYLHLRAMYLVHIGRGCSLRIPAWHTDIRIYTYIRTHIYKYISVRRDTRALGEKKRESETLPRASWNAKELKYLLEFKSSAPRSI